MTRHPCAFHADRYAEGVKHRTLKHWLLLIALVMRFAVPGGFMLDPANAAGPALIACEGQGTLFAATPVQAAMDSHHGHQQRLPAHPDCSYSPLAAVGDVPPVVVLAPWLRGPPVMVQPSAGLPTRALRRASLPPPSTGPPVVD